MVRRSNGRRRNGDKAPGTTSSTRPAHGTSSPRPSPIRARLGRLERLVATVPGVLFDYQLRADGTDEFLWVSEASRELLELEPEALQQDSRRLWSMVPPEELPALIETVKLANRTGSRFEAEFRVRLPSGRVRWLQACSDPVAGLGGPERIWSGLVVDTSDLHQAMDALDHERAQFRSLTENLPDPVFRLAKDGRVRYLNPAARRLVPIPDPIGKLPAEFGLTPETAPTWRDALERSNRGEVVKCELSASTAAGLRHFEVLFIPEPVDGAVESVLTTGHDITERVLAERSLRESDRRKSEFLAMLSHELRNPLAPIRNALYILSRAAPGSDQALRALAVIDRQIGQLARLVDDLLDLTRIERNRMQLERQRLELNELVRRTAEDHRSTFDAAGVTLRIETSPEALYVNGDPARLAQVFANLLHNAAKFTARGGAARVEVSRSGERAQVRVSDNGMGMTPETLSSVFQPFTQEETGLARSKGGLGLGLALVKGLVDFHGGAVSARSEGPGRGSTFEVSLPLLEAPARVEPAPFTHRRRRILIVEDNVDAATTLREVLELEGHEVQVAHAGTEAIARAHERVPEILLCDIGLPGMNGYDVARTFRQDPALQQVHLVAVSGYALPDDVRRATDAGFELHLSKPPSLDRLEATLESIG